MAKKIKISRELAFATIDLVHARFMDAAMKEGKDVPYWRDLQLECEGIRNRLIEKSLGIGRRK